MQPMQHLFAWTNPLPELAGATREAEHAILRHQDRDAYYRQRGEQYGIGSYAHDPLPIDVPELNRGKEGHQIAQGDFTPEHFTDTWDATRMLVPPVYAAGVAESFNGHFAFTPDSYPLLGESSHTRGLFFAEGIWVTHAGGSATGRQRPDREGRPGHRPRSGAPRPLPAPPLRSGLRARARRTSSTSRSTTSCIRCSSWSTRAACVPRPTTSASSSGRHSWSRAPAGSARSGSSRTRRSSRRRTCSIATAGGRSSGRT